MRSYTFSFDVDDFKKSLENAAHQLELQEAVRRPKITKVIHNDPATVVKWTDGTKTVVKCGEHDKYDPEKGLAMAMAKKYFGNEGKYYNEIAKWLPAEGDNAQTKKAKNSKECAKCGESKSSEVPLDRDELKQFLGLLF